MHSKSPYFGIMVNETIDISTSSQLILYIKVLDQIGGEFITTVEYLDLIMSANNGTTEDLIVILKNLIFTDCRWRYCIYGTQIIWNGHE